MPIVPVIEPLQATEQDLHQACHHHDLALHLRAQGHYGQALAHGQQALPLALCVRTSESLSRTTRRFREVGAAMPVIAVSPVNEDHLEATHEALRLLAPDL